MLTCFLGDRPAAQPPFLSTCTSPPPPPSTLQLPLSTLLIRLADFNPIPTPSMDVEDAVLTVRPCPNFSLSSARSAVDNALHCPLICQNKSCAAFNSSSLTVSLSGLMRTAVSLPLKEATSSSSWRNLASFQLVGCDEGLAEWEPPTRTAGISGVGASSSGMSKMDEVVAGDGVVCRRMADERRCIVETCKCYEALSCRCCCLRYCETTSSHSSSSRSHRLLRGVEQVLSSPLLH